METPEPVTILTREDLRKRGWTARQIRKQKPDTIIRVKHRGRPKFGHSLANVLAVEAAVAEARGKKKTTEPIAAVA